MTTHAQALARIEGEIKRIDRHRVLSFESLGSTNEELFEKQLSFLHTLKAVLELHKPRGGNYRSDKPQCFYCSGLCHSYSGLNCEDEGDGVFPCPTADLIIKGIL